MKTKEELVLSLDTLLAWISDMDIQSYWTFEDCMEEAGTQIYWGGTDHSIKLLAQVIWWVVCEKRESDRREDD